MYWQGEGSASLRSCRSFLGECTGSPRQTPALGLLTTTVAMGLLLSWIMRVLESLI